MVFSQVLNRKQSHYKQLHKNWSKKHTRIKNQLVQKHGSSLEFLANTVKSEHIKASALGGMMLLSIPSQISLPYTHEVKNEFAKPFDASIFAVSDLAKVLPPDVRPLTSNEEASVAAILSRDYEMRVTPKLNGIRLNTTYGKIGTEQHLYRYPGDILDNHVTSQNERNLYYASGIAPGVGAWGYFAPSEAKMTITDENREKYYLAVQTFLAPGYASNSSKYYQFFKYRKMLVVNPYSGQAVVADIADVGPAEWTGKQLGGSPEVMYNLGLFDGARKGPVLYFFIDDPNDTIPLGPIAKS